MTIRIKKAAAGMVTTLCVTACYPVVDYEYLSLSESMEVVEYGRTNARDVSNDAEMPIKYRLDRDDYTLFASVDKELHSPAVIIEIESENIPGIAITGTYIRCAGLVQKINQAEVERYGYSANGFRFIWAPSKTGPCVNSIVLPREDRKIEVSIYDSDLQLVAVEKIMFEVKKNGDYRNMTGPMNLYDK